MAPPNRENSATLGLMNNEYFETIFDLSGGKFTVKGVSLLSQVPDNVSFSSLFSVISSQSYESNAPPSLFQRVISLSHKGGFFGFSKEESSDRLMNSLGSFSGKNFLSVFRFKTWWSTHWVGNSGSDLQMETQWVLIDIPEIKSYLIIIPIIEGCFRSALHPGYDGHIIICAESGSTQVKALSFNSIAYVQLGENPYILMKDAYSALRVHLNTFKLLEEKTLPNLVDKFGWCTWDAFYLTVDPIGIWHGLEEFSKSGVEPRFLIIDDGWQSISLDGDDPNEDARNLVLGGEQMNGRLHRLDECDKFKKYKSGLLLGPDSPPFNPKKFIDLIAKGIEHEHLDKQLEDAILHGNSNIVVEIELKIKQVIKEIDDLFGGEQQSKGECSKENEYGLKAFTRDLRTRFKGLDDIYVWHALCGAWGGVRPGTTHFNSNIVPCKLSQGLDGTMQDLAVVKLVKGAINLAKAYYEGLTNSIVKNFNGNGIIASMQQCNDFFFLGTKQISMGRVGDDFWFQDPNGDPMGVFWLQGVHMIHCSYNSLWMGQMIQPDWDMFKSDHACAKFHAGSRAICGGPIYLSDNVGSHDIDLIKKLVFPDGTVPKCIHFPLPTRDCLFKNPLFDQSTALKIWNFNKYAGVIGVFNCQGAGWDPKVHKFRGYPECYKPINGTVHVTEVEWDQKKEAAHMGKAQEYVVYLNQAEEIFLMTIKSEPIKFTIQPSSFELYNFIPVTKLGGIIKFAPIGLTNMFNSGGTILELEHVESGTDIGAIVKLKVKGSGNFIAYSSESPKKFQVNGSEVALEWLSNGKVMVNLPWIEKAGGISDLAIFF